MDSDEQKRLIKRIAIIAGLFVGAFVLYSFRLRSLLIAYALVVAVLTVLAILLQSGRGGGLASIGGLGGDSLFGARSSTPIAKATYVMAALLLFSCMLIARMGPVEGARVEGVIGEPETPATQLPPNIDVPEEAPGSDQEETAGAEAPAEGGGP